MSEQDQNKKGKFATDWLLRGVLTKVGDAFDRLTGRGYRPSSSLATSELIEKLKKLLDHEVRDGKFVPHNIKLKMQWDKFSTDSGDSLKRLETELRVAVIDHINDFRYHTYAPVSLQIKPDYFTEGVKLLVSFDKFDEDEREVAVSVTVPQIKVGDFVPPEIDEPAIDPEPVRFIAHFEAAGKTKAVDLEFNGHQRLSVGRGGENDLVIDDSSVSKIHASLVVNSDGVLAVADTGSTNGTFVAGNRIAYGKAIAADSDGVIKFGSIGVHFEQLSKPESADVSDAPTEEFKVALDGDGPASGPTLVAPAPRIEIIKKIEQPKPAGDPPQRAGDPPQPEAEPAAGDSAEPAAESAAEPTAERIVLDFDQEA